MNGKKTTKLIKRRFTFDSLLKSLKSELAVQLGNSRQPQLLGNPRQPQSSESHLMILLDVSSSMNKGDKVSQAKSGCRGFAEEMTSAGFAVGIITFSTTVTEILKPTRNIREIYDAINPLKASGSTNMADAIVNGMDRLLAWEARRMLFLVTDGMPDDKNKAIQMADEAKRLGIEIYTHGTKDADEEFLRKIASNKEIVRTVQDHLLGEGICDMASSLKRLPPPRRLTPNEIPPKKTRSLPRHFG
jgi:Mg-chelatase subunit ChlD